MSTPSFRMYHKGRVVSVSWHEDSDSPPESEESRRRWRWRWLTLLVLLLLGMLVFWRFVPEIPVDYSDTVEHFKYGSIGTEEGNGLPYWIWKILPEAFPEYLPGGGKEGYAALGFTYETDENGEPRDTPIGFSKRRMQGFDRVGLNCAVCHTSTYRLEPGAAPVVLTTMPAHKLDLLGYFNFIFQCANDGRFNNDYLLPLIEAKGNLGAVERFIYRLAIPVTRDRILQLRSRASFMLEHPSGPGRIDTFTPYKAIQFAFQDTSGYSVGNADFPSIWNQKPREGMELHWDGNNSSVDERNISASIGAGATPVSLDSERLKRVREWIWNLAPPKYPAPAAQGDSAERGQVLYKQHCAGCHDVGAPKFRDPEGHEYGVGEVVPIDEIGTDRERLDSYTLDLNQNQYTLGSGTEWRFSHFRKTNGYSNMPLDGIWARGPYLHNGSVPTLRDLLDPPYSDEEFAALKLPAVGSVTDAQVTEAVAKARSAGRRPPLFFRGGDVLDQQRVGFECDRPGDENRPFLRFDVRVRGNGNGGHIYGADLSGSDKDAIVEFMKSL